MKNWMKFLVTEHDKQYDGAANEMKSGREKS